MNDPDDPWGKDFWASQPDSAAIGLLQRQECLRASKTDDIVQGVVKQRVDGGTVWASLYARVPAPKN